MKRILCALLVLSMLIVPVACQRTEAPGGDKAVTENGTVAPGWTPEGSPEEGGPVDTVDENGGEPGDVPEGQPVVEIPVVTEAVPDKEVKSLSIKTQK